MTPVLTPSVRRALADALTLVLPVDCAGCGRPDIALCELCRRALDPVPVVRDDAGLPTAAALSFEDVPARVIRALKEDGRTPLARALAPALRAAAVAVGAHDAVVVPVPTSRSSFRRRGFRVVDLVARRAGLTPVRLLRAARQTFDQRGLTRDQRRGNVAGALRARDAEGLRVLIVDDVVTTGATLAEARRALEAAGAIVVGAAAIARTPRRWAAGESTAADR